MLSLRRISENTQLLLKAIIVFSMVGQSAAPAFAADQGKKDDGPQTQTGGSKGPPIGPNTPVMLYSGGMNRGARRSFSPALQDTNKVAYYENGKVYFGGDVYQTGTSPFNTDILIAIDPDVRTTRVNDNGDSVTAYGAPRDSQGRVRILTTNNEGQIMEGVILPGKGANADVSLLWKGTVIRGIPVVSYAEQGRFRTHTYYGGDLYQSNVRTPDGRTWEAHFLTDPRLPFVRLGSRGLKRISSVVYDLADNPRPILLLQPPLGVDYLNSHLAVLQANGKILDIHGLIISEHQSIQGFLDFLWKNGQGIDINQQEADRQAQFEMDALHIEAKNRGSYGEALAVIAKRHQDDRGGPTRERSPQDLRETTMPRNSTFISGTRVYYGGETLGGSVEGDKSITNVTFAVDPLKPSFVFPDGQTISYSVTYNSSATPEPVVTGINSQGQRVYGLAKSILVPASASDSGNSNSMQKNRLPFTGKPMKAGIRLVFGEPNDLGIYPAQLKSMQEYYSSGAFEIDTRLTAFVKNGVRYFGGDTAPVDGGEKWELKFAIDKKLPFVEKNGRFASSVAFTKNGEPILTGRSLKGERFYAVLTQDGQTKINTGQIDAEQVKRMNETYRVRDAYQRAFPGQASATGDTQAGPTVSAGPGTVDSSEHDSPQDPARPRSIRRRSGLFGPKVVHAESTMPAEDVPYLPSHLDNTLGPAMSQQLKELMRNYRNGSLAQIGRTAKNMSISIPAGAGVFYLALAATALYMAHYHPETNPMGWDDFKENLTLTSALMVMGFGVIAYPAFTQLNNPANRSFGRMLKYNSLGLIVAGVTTKAIQMMANDSDVKSCIVTGGKDQTACDAAMKRWDLQFLVENFSPVVVNSLLTAAIVSGALIATNAIVPQITQALGLAGMTLTSNPIGATVLSIGVVAGGTVFFFKAYEFSQWLTGNMEMINRAYASHWSWRDEKGGANIGDAQDSFIKEWKRLQDSKFVPDDVATIDGPIMVGSDAQKHRDDFDTMASLMFHYNSKLEEWRKLQLLPAVGVFSAWARKVTNFNLTRKYTYDAYKEVIKRIAAERQDASVKDKFDSDWVQDSIRGERTLSDTSGVQQLMVPPNESIGYAGTKTITDYILASMACGTEVEAASVTDSRSFLSAGLDMLESLGQSSWSPVGKGRESVIENPVGSAVAFHAPRITENIPSNLSICNAPMRGTTFGSGTAAARDFRTPINSKLEPLLGTRLQAIQSADGPGQPTASILDYIKADLRKTILGEKGENNFTEWWLQHVEAETNMKEVEKSLDEEYKTGVLAAYDPILNDHRSYCYPSIRTSFDPKQVFLFRTDQRPTIDKWPGSARMIDNDCGSDRYLARGTLDSISDEFYVFDQFMIDAITTGDNNTMMLTPKDKAAFLNLTTEYEYAFRHLADPATLHMGNASYVELGSKFEAARDQVKQFMRTAVDKIRCAADDQSVVKADQAAIDDIVKKNFPVADGKATPVVTSDKPGAAVSVSSPAPGKAAKAAKPGAGATAAAQPKVDANQELDCSQFAPPAKVKNANAANYAAGAGAGLPPSFPRYLAVPSAIYKKKLALVSMDIIDGLAQELSSYIAILNNPQFDTVQDQGDIEKLKSDLTGEPYDASDIVGDGGQDSDQPQSNPNAANLKNQKTKKVSPNKAAGAHI